MVDEKGLALQEQDIHQPDPAVETTRSTRPFKAFYFLFFAGLAALFPFLSLYFEQLGMTGRQIGVLGAIPPLMFLVAASLWGGLADATQQRRLLLLVALAGTIICALALSASSASSAFLTLGVLIAGFAFFMAPINPLVDNSALEALGERKNQYGKLRLWGAVGWGLCAPFAGWLIERSGLRWSFYAYALAMVMGMAVALRLPIGQVGLGGSFWRGFRLLMANRRWVFFLVVVFIAGLGAGLINNYLFLYLNQLNAGESFMGLALAVATISELTVFAFSDRMLERWGTGLMLASSIVAMVVRLLAYSVVVTPWVVLLIQLLHGFTFAALWTAGVSYAHKAAPRGLGATAQGVFSGVTMGLAVATGALIGGWLYQSAGPFLMFRWVGIGIAVALLVAALASKYLVGPEPTKQD